MGRTQLRTLAAASLAFALGTGALARPAAPAPATAWLNGRWFDGQQFQQIDLYSIGPRLTLKRPRRIDRTVDLSQTYVTPAFGEAHNHNIPSPDTDATIRTYLTQGIYYVMIQANLPDAPSTLAGRINTPSSIDVAFADGVFTAPGGHPSALVRRNIASGGMHDVDLHDGFILAAPSRDDVDRLWWRVVRPHHPDFIKIILVYSEDRLAGVPVPQNSDRYGLDPSLVPYIVRKAHGEGLRVSAHVESAKDFEIAVDAGVDVIAHFPGFWPDPARISPRGPGIYLVSDSAAAKAGRNRVTVITTLGEALRTFATDKAYAAVGEQMVDVYRRNLARLTAHGVRLAIGSDQFRGSSIPEALELHKAGLLPASALLRALSIDAATAIFPKRAPFGPVEGAPADFLVLPNDPLADFTAITRIIRRVKAGVDLPEAAKDRA
jgi:hypothetical protein